MKPFVHLFGINAADQQMRKIAIAATRAGYAVVPVKAGGKAPICTLNAQELKEAGERHACGVHHAILDDKVAGRVFKRKGFENVNLGIVAGPSRLVVVDADTPEAVNGFLGAWAQAEDDEAYLTRSPTVRTPGSLRDGEWKHHDGGHWYFSLPDGLELWDPDVAASATEFTDPSGFNVRWGWQMTVAPPSVRSEGAYEPVGGVVEVPAWLLHRVRDIERQKEARLLRNLELFANDDVARWAATMSWDDLLTPDGWTNTSKHDGRCGCPVFEKPGGGSFSDRSAIGHENDCEIYENIEGHGPLHLFTDDPPEPLASYLAQHGTKTITKLQYLAITRHDGNVDLAKMEAGIGFSEADMDEWLGVVPAVPISPESGPTAPSEKVPLGTNETPAQSTDLEGETRVPDPYTGASDGTTPPSQTLAHVEQAREQAQSPALGMAEGAVDDEDEVVADDVNEDDDVNEVASVSEAQRVLDGIPEKFRSEVKAAAGQLQIREWAKEVRAAANTPPGFALNIISLADVVPSEIRPDVGHRTDDVPLLYRGRVNTIFGPSESAKSWFAIACAADVVARGGRAFILDVEDDDQGFAHRIASINADPAGVMYARINTTLTPGERHDIADVAATCDLLVVDSLDGFVAVNADEDTNSATSIRRAFSLMKGWAQGGDCAVLVVDHATEKLKPGEKSDTQMGSSAKKQVIDGSILRADKVRSWAPMKGGETAVMVGKDRHGWAKLHAEFESDNSTWGRAARLTMAPTLDGDVLSIIPPRPYGDDEPTPEELDAIDEAEQTMFEKLAGLRDDEWISRKQLFIAGGDKNGRSGQPEALERLVAGGMIDHRLVRDRINEYRLKPEGDE